MKISFTSGAINFLFFWFSALIFKFRTYSLIFLPLTVRFVKHEAETIIATEQCWFKSGRN